MKKPYPLDGTSLQLFDDKGAPLAAGTLDVYIAGTTTRAVSYGDVDGEVEHTNPIILDESGFVPETGRIYLDEIRAYKIIVKNRNGGLVASYDNIFVGDQAAIDTGGGSGVPIPPSGGLVALNRVITTTNTVIELDPATTVPGAAPLLYNVPGKPNMFSIGVPGTDPVDEPGSIFISDFSIRVSSQNPAENAFIWFSLEATNLEGNILGTALDLPASTATSRVFLPAIPAYRYYQVRITRSAVLTAPVDIEINAVGITR